MENIHQKIAHYRKQKELTQEQLGTMLGVSGQAVSKWEKGESMPDILLLPQICQIFGISADTLLDVAPIANSDNTIEKCIAYMRENGRETALHEFLSRTLNGMSGHSLTGSSVDIAYKTTQVHDQRGMAFLIANKEYKRLCFDYDNDEVSKILQFLADKYVLGILKHIQPDRAVTKADILQATGFEENIVDKCLLGMMEHDYISMQIDTEKRQGYMSNGRMAFVHMIMSGISSIMNNTHQWYIRN